MRYIFDESKCTELFAGMIHSLAVFAAITNRWPVTMVDTRDGDALLPTVTIPAHSWTQDGTLLNRL